jgi:mono/diheme cytochrome c family protein
MPHTTVLLSLSIAVAGIGATAACGGARGGGAAAAAVAEQTDQGEDVFRRRCAQCHGPDGRGGRAPNVMGQGALTARPVPENRMRTQTFQTAADLLAWTSKKMPPGTAEDLTSAEHAAVLAYMLSETGYKLGPRPLDPQTAKAIRLR